MVNTVQLKVETEGLSLHTWKFNKEVVLAVLYEVYLVRLIISLVDTVLYS